MTVIDLAATNCGDRIAYVLIQVELFASISELEQKKKLTKKELKTIHPSHKGILGTGGSGEKGQRHRFIYERWHR